MRKRDFKTSFLLMLRHAGMLCKKPVEPKRKIRVSHTVYPNGNQEIRPIDAEIHVFLQNKKAAFPECRFDIESRRCTCGVMGIDQFAAEGCSVKKSFKTKKS
jgi:hypothetical protein